MGDGGLPTSLAIIIVAAVVMVFGIAGLIISKILLALL
jgi:hypothetical protein